MKRRKTILIFILNDMRMAPEESAALIARFQPCLKDGGTVVLTLKLFGDKPRRQMLARLTRWATITALCMCASCFTTEAR